VKQIRTRLTYANVMSSLAVFLILSGATAFAATKIGSNEIKSNAITTGKIKKEAVAKTKIKNSAVDASKLANSAVTTDKVADSAVTSGKLADNAVTTGKIANSAVTAGKLAAGERSEAFVVEEPSGTVEFEKSLFEPPTTVVTLKVPTGGSYVVTANTEIIFSIGTSPPETALTECYLNDDGTSIGEMSDTTKEGLIFPSGGVSVSGISDGGTLTLACKSNTKNTFAFKRKIIAVRVGSVG
jgi:hypothetical protein